MPDVIQPVGELLQEFALSLLTPALQPEVIDGAGNLPRFRLSDGGPLYGAIFTAFTIPPGLGRSNTIVPTYYETLLKLSYMSVLKNGNEAIARVDLIDTGIQLVRFWNGPFIRCQYEVLPGVQFNVSYLIL